MTLSEIRESYSQEGFDYENASARTSQDVVLSLIGNSALSESVTIKGGIVMQRLSHDSRRATQDIDLDFIRYSINDESILRFIQSLNSSSDEYALSVVGSIEELKHQDYSGKRVHALIADNTGTTIRTKIDIGVHKNTDLAQQTLSFDLGKLDDAVTLLANSKEQIIAEKAKSLLRIGAASTRYKDVFDIYYFVTEEEIDSEVLRATFATLVFSDETMRENTMEDVWARLDSVLNNRRFLPELRNAKNNWLQMAPEKVIAGILKFFADQAKL